MRALQIGQRQGVASSSLVLKGPEIEIQRALIAVRQGSAGEPDGTCQILRLQGVENVLVPVAGSRRAANS